MDGMRWRERDGIRWLEAGLPGATAAFSTRLGGCSEGSFASLNLGLLTGDRRQRVRENRARLAAALKLPGERIVLGRQVHGADLASHRGPQSPSPYADPGSAEPPEVDGHLSAEPGLGLLVLVADCLPIALAGPRGVAMLHGGWRGLAADIVEDAVAAVGADAAAIGPGIGPCCYEVGTEVLGAFAPLGPGLTDGRMLDLPAVARRLLERAGVARIEDAGLCTRCNPELFFSHRGQGPGTGRQGGLAWRSARWPS
jgi:polyphenol oxidase